MASGSGVGPGSQSEFCDGGSMQDPQKKRAPACSGLFSSPPGSS